MPKILVVDDHEIFRNGLVALLTTVYEDIEIAQAANAEDVESIVREGLPELVILDHEMPGVSGLEIFRSLRSRYPRLRVVFLTGMHSGILVRQLVSEGAVAVLGKSGTGDELLTIINRQLSEPTYVSEVFESDLQQSEVLETLTRRELESLKHLLNGKTTQEIADAMGVSFKTAETHRTRLMAKMDVHSFSELMARAEAMGLTRL